MVHTTLSKIYQITGFILFGCLVTALPTTSAQAGFQWVPPSQTSNPNPIISAPPPPPFPNMAISRGAGPMPSYAPPPPFEPRIEELNTEPLEPLPVLKHYNPAPIQPIQQPKRFVATPTPMPPAALMPQAPHQKQYGQFIPNRNQASIPAMARTTEIYGDIPPPPIRRQSAAPYVVLPDDAPASARGTINPYPDIRSAPPPVSTRMPAAYSAPAYQPNNVSHASTFSNVVGFGSEVPLALALGQIVPAEYSYSFAPGINLGSRVSWDGGKPWNDVVSDMVTPLGYGLLIEGKNIKITGQRYSSNVVVPSQVMPFETALAVPNPYMPSSVRVATLAKPIRSYSTPSIGTPIGGLPFEQALIEPAAGDESITLSKVTPRSAPIVTTKESVTSALEALEPVITPRRHRRNPGENTGQQNNKPAFSLKNVTKAGNIDVASQAAPITPWNAKRGDSLKDTLARWSKQAGMQLVWDASHDFTLSSDIQSGGTFEDAVGAVFSHAMGGQDAPDVHFVSGLGNKTKQVFVRNHA